MHMPFDRFRGNSRGAIRRGPGQKRMNASTLDTQSWSACARKQPKKKKQDLTIAYNRLYVDFVLQLGEGGYTHCLPPS